MFHVVTGGSGSGKSAFAEQCILDCQGNNRIYIATMYPFDEESHRRIARHRAMRAEKKFTTIERYTDLEHLTIPQGADVLLECMSNLTANEIYQEGGARGQYCEGDPEWNPPSAGAGRKSGGSDERGLFRRRHLRSGDRKISGKTWCDQLSDGADRRYSHRGCLRNSDFS